jgi:predicted lipoprotein with Yx(FWY)xxD motif
MEESTSPGRLKGQATTRGDQVKRSILAILAGAAVLAIPASGLAGNRAPTVKLRKTGLGKILVNSKGFTLYMFTRDRRNKDNCYKISSSFGRCRDSWPPLPTKGKPTAGPGVKASLLGKIKLPNGTWQVTYNGHPLYTYAFDSGPGQTSYVGCPQFGGTWKALNAAGKAVNGNCG